MLLGSEPQCGDVFGRREKSVHFPKNSCSHRDSRYCKVCHHNSSVFFKCLVFTDMKTSLIKVKRGQKGYGLSLVYRGPDKYEEKDLGVFVSRVVAGGQAERYGLR